MSRSRLLMSPVLMSIALLAAGLMAAACGGGEEGGGTTTPRATAAGTPRATGTPAAGLATPGPGAAATAETLLHLRGLDIPPQGWADYFHDLMGFENEEVEQVQIFCDLLRNEGPSGILEHWGFADTDVLRYGATIVPDQEGDRQDAERALAIMLDECGRY